METIGEGAALFAAAVVAGAINAVAGGGTLVTFPTLLAIGLDHKIANATSTVGLLTGMVGSVAGYRREVRLERARVPVAALTGVSGGALGAWLLTRTPPGLFAALVPFLILGATFLFILQETVLASRRVTDEKEAAAAPDLPAGPVRKLAVGAALFSIATYGGYFGAGMGILLLASLRALGISSLHRANALKVVIAGCANGVASAIFIASGLALWPEAAVMVVGSSFGGYWGADAARRLGQPAVRWIVIGVGLGAGVFAAWKRFL